MAPLLYPDQHIVEESMPTRDRNPRVLVLDGDSQASLGVVRSLGKRGVAISIGAASTPSLSGFSRHVDHAVRFPDPAASPGEFADALHDELESGRYEAVIPTRDDTTTVVSRHKDRLADTGTLVGVEDWDRYQLTADKERTFELAARLDVPIPETVAPRTIADVESYAPDLPYPVVVKSRSKHVEDPSGALVTQEVDDGQYATTPAELVEIFRDLQTAHESLREHPPIVQEYIPGQTTTTVGVARDGTLLTHFQERRLRTTPASGGSSTLIRGFRDDRLATYAAEVVDALDWTGPIQVEFMRTPTDEYRLIEVNGRYWGSTPLAIASGVDIPAIHYAVLRGNDPTTPDTYRDDVVQQRLLYGDIKWLTEQLETGNNWALVPFVEALITADQVFLSFDDPVPTLAAVKQAAAIARDSMIEGVWSQLTG